ncbi:hypothetical protein BN1050_02619 [Metalysinibacillus saudimassiliensis]|uniref:Uncharacterized protein n=1 Tax=Metalysinibacillus saudimassiliensis TaxID=1461583 RepID=A0A078MHG7_9BACL|nr:hypothetical protein BN1050_02619 [Metalysinibacillus saudimassiliensis]
MKYDFLSKLMRFIINKNGKRVAAIQLSSIPTMVGCIAWSVVEILEFGSIKPNFYHDFVALLFWVSCYLVIKFLLDMEDET